MRLNTDTALIVAGALMGLFTCTMAMIKFLLVGQQALFEIAAFANTINLTTLLTLYVATKK